jgi:hypothetical protein
MKTKIIKKVSSAWSKTINDDMSLNHALILFALLLAAGGIVLLLSL